MYIRRQKTNIRTICFWNNIHTCGKDWEIQLGPLGGWSESLFITHLHLWFSSCPPWYFFIYVLIWINSFFRLQFWSSVIHHSRHSVLLLDTSRQEEAWIIHSLSLSPTHQIHQCWWYTVYSATLCRKNTIKQTQNYIK